MKHPVKYNTIEELTLDNKLWYWYAFEISKNKQLADDMVSDMYLKMILTKEQQPNKTFSKSYIYTTLKNYHLKAIEPKPKQIIIDRQASCEYIPDTDAEPQDDGIDSIEFYKYVIDYLNVADTREDWFHHTIFKYVYIDGLSIRELERRSKIHFNILQSSIQSTKKKLKENYKPKNG